MCICSSSLIYVFKFHLVTHCPNQVPRNYTSGTKWNFSEDYGLISVMNNISVLFLLYLNGFTLGRNATQKKESLSI